MKLYTEEQVKVMLGKARLHNMDDTEMFTDDYLIEQQTPIELPNKQEIIEKALEVGFTNTLFIDGASWVIDKIQGGNND